MSLQHLFDEKRWEDLEKQFKQEHLSLNGLPKESLLSIVLQAGLSALKTP